MTSVPPKSVPTTNHGSPPGSYYNSHSSPPAPTQRTSPVRSTSRCVRPIRCVRLCRASSMRRRRQGDDVRFTRGLGISTFTSGSTLRWQLRIILGFTMRSFSCFAVLLLTVVDRVFRLYRVSRWIHGSNDCSNAKSYCSTRFSVKGSMTPNASPLKAHHFI